MACDLVLELGPGDNPGEYRVDVDSPAGEATGSARLDVDLLLGRRREVAATVLASSVPARGPVAAHEMPVREIGVDLFAAVFADRIYGRYTASLQEAAGRAEPLRLILRLHAPELAGLPWEALFDPETNEYLCQREPVLRFVEVAQAPAPLLVEPPLRILGFVAAPRDLATLDVAEEQRRLSEALSALHDDGLVELVWAPGGSWSVLQSTLLKGPWHVVHFIGHGGLDPSGETGVLALEDAQRGSVLVSANRFARLLGTARPVPRLVVLNSCQSGEAAADDLLSSTAASLVHSGTSAAVAMQFAITDAAALAFSSGFYEALAHDTSVEEAVRMGRIAIDGTSERTLEWLTPVLYSRTKDTNLFAVKTREPRVIPRPDTAPSAEVRLMYFQALAAARVERWEEAITLFDSVLTRAPDYEDATERRADARRAQDLNVAYDRARTAEANGDWRIATKEYTHILAIDPNFRDAAARRDACERAMRSASLQEQIRILGANQDWEGVLAASRELESLDETLADVDGLPTRARHALQRPSEADRAESERSQRIIELQKQLVALDRQHDWHKVLAVSGELLALDPTTTEPRNYAAKAREALQNEAQTAQNAAAQTALVHDLQERMRALARDHEWRAVLAVSAQMQGLDPSAADPDGLAATARAEVRRQDEETRAASVRQRKILDLQQGMRKAARKHDWQKVLRTSGELARIDPALADTDGLATRAIEATRTGNWNPPAKNTPPRRGRNGNRVLGAVVVIVFLLGALFVIGGVANLNEPEYSDLHQGAAGEIFFGIACLVSVIPLAIWFAVRFRRGRASSRS